MSSAPPSSCPAMRTAAPVSSSSKNAMISPASRPLTARRRRDAQLEGGGGSAGEGGGDGVQPSGTSSPNWSGTAASISWPLPPASNAEQSRESAAVDAPSPSNPSPAPPLTERRRRMTHGSASRTTMVEPAYIPSIDTRERITAGANEVTAASPLYTASSKASRSAPGDGSGTPNVRTMRRWKAS